MNLKFILYRYRFLFFYIIFGFASLILEMIVIRFFLSFNFPFYPTSFIGFFIGLLSAFVLNVRYNFHIPKPKQKKALLYFSFISFISFLVQLVIREYLSINGFDMEMSRFLIAGMFFIVSYLFHRKFSFNEFKKVGVAIYADGVEDIKSIHKKISNVTDFIHLDIVDKSFNPNCKEVKAYRAEVVKAYWQDKDIEVHIMSKHPSRWINDIVNHVDVIYIHPSINEDLGKTLLDIKEKGCKPGVAISVNEPIDLVQEYLDSGLIKHVLLLAIPKPGFSGQKFDINALSVLENLNKNKCRKNFKICVDGGVNRSTIKFLNVESIVSGSFVLSSDNPIKNIMYLQTSGEYAEY